MARKESITKTMLLEAAFELVKDEGIENLTARKLAAKAGCSTQPIFRTYKNMEEVSQTFIKILYENGAKDNISYIIVLYHK